jgi:hypothetical protein
MVTVEEGANKYAEGVGELQPAATPQGRRDEGGQNAESVGESRVRLSLANAFSVAKTGCRATWGVPQAEIRQRLRHKTSSRTGRSLDQQRFTSLLEVAGAGFIHNRSASVTYLELRRVWRMSNVARLVYARLLFGV